MRSQLKLALVIAAIAPLVLSAQRPSGFAANGPTDPPGTFSILGFDPETGEIGAAVQSKVFSAGNGVLWAEAGVGAVATQAIVDVSYGPQGLALLKQGMAPADIIKKIYADDPDPGLRGGSWAKAGRQFAVMNAKGEVAAFEAGQKAGGDHRGQQSAALIVVKKDAGVWLHNDVVLHLQVDDSPEPIKELRRLVEMSPAARQGRGRGGE